MNRLLKLLQTSYKTTNGSEYDPQKKEYYSYQIYWAYTQIKEDWWTLEGFGKSSIRGNNRKNHCKKEKLTSSNDK